MTDPDHECVDVSPDQRALILAGGGLKVAFQAGALQVLLDEAKLEFGLADGTSGGTFNLAMWCQEMTGTQIAENWRRFSPAKGVAVNLPGGLLGPFGPGLFSFRKYRKDIFPAWGIRPELLPTTSRHARFNVFNFTDQRLESRLVSDMDTDVLVACNSLPFWFPPVRGRGRAGDEGGTAAKKTLLDAVYVTDANIEQAIADGARDIVVIWTLSTRGVWRHGFWQQYFQAIEESGNGAFRRISERIEANNLAVVRDECSEFGRHICMRILEAEVPLNYIFNFRRDRMAAAVELGVKAARAWCDRYEIDHAEVPPSTPCCPPGYTPPVPPDATTAPATAPHPLPPADPESPSLDFKETMRGSMETTEPRMGHVVKLDAEAHISEIGRFITDPDHEVAIGGTITSEYFGGRCPIINGRLNLLTFVRDPGNGRMHYVLTFDDSTGAPYTLIGDKYVVDQPGWDMWRDTTTLMFNVWRGHLGTAPSDGIPVARGQVRISMPGFMRQQLTMRSHTGSLGKDAAVIGRFYGFFLGRLWDVYAQKVLPWSPF